MKIELSTTEKQRKKNSCWEKGRESMVFGTKFAPGKLIGSVFRPRPCDVILPTMNATRSASKQPEIREQDLQGLKYFDQLAPLLSRLHEVGCQRDRAQNRTLHFDQYC